MKQHLNIKVCGQVQGVGFRYSSRQKAIELELRGFVQNERDGSVYIEVEGEAVNLEKFLNWCRQGPWGQGVGKVTFETKDKLKGFNQFVIKY